MAAERSEAVASSLSFSLVWTHRESAITQPGDFPSAPADTENPSDSRREQSSLLALSHNKKAVGQINFFVVGYSKRSAKVF